MLYILKVIGTGIIHGVSRRQWDFFIILCMMQECAELTSESKTPPAVGILIL